jgi:hypothetical protein
MNAPMRHSRSMIRQVNLEDANECARIDAWVRAHSEGTPFHLTPWMKGVSRGTGQEALYLIAEARSGDIQGLLPLHLIHSPLFGRALVSSGFAVGGGILADSPAVANKLADAAWNIAERRCPCQFYTALDGR